MKCLRILINRGREVVVRELWLRVGKVGIGLDLVQSQLNLSNDLGVNDFFIYIRN